MLIDELQKGSESAFKKLVDLYQGRVYNTCIGFLKDPDEADDISQEVFIEVYQSIATFQRSARLSTWIYRIAVNKCLEHQRRRQRRKRWALLSSLWNTKTDVAQEPDSFSHPGVALENRERATILMSKVEALPKNQRIAFTLHKLEGLPYEEIASVMGTSVSAVESLIVRAKANLKKALQEYYGQL